MARKYPENILVVDDDVNLLAGIARQFHGKFNITTAVGGIEGLSKLKVGDQYAVIIVDMNMPDMNGIQFLTKVQESFPSIVRMMLTGNTDLETAMHAVNECNIFRFLVKPCHNTIMELAIEEGIKQYRLVTAEKEILERTLNGSVQILTDLLTLVSPVAFSRASRLKSYVLQIARSLKLEPIWQFELAAMFSQMGCLTIPPDTLEKSYSGSILTPEEEDMFRTHPQVGGELLAKIPRLEVVSKMVTSQRERYDQYIESPGASQDDNEFIGGYLLKLAIDFDTLISRGKTKSQAFGELKKCEAKYHPRILAALEGVEALDIERKVEVVKYQQLNNTMILADDICTRNMVLVSAKGQQVTSSMRALLRNYVERKEVSEDIRVFVPVMRAKHETPVSTPAAS